MNSPRRLSLSLAGSLVVWMVPRAAQANDSAAAESLFDAGKQLVAQGRYDEACPKFAESDHFDPGIGTKFHLADCWEHVGRTASAWSLFREVESEAHLGHESGRERVARDRAAALEPFLSKLAIKPDDAARLPYLEVRRDGVEVDRAHWNAPVTVDPGPHVVAVDAPGKQAWQATIDVPPQGKIVTVEVPPLVDLRPVAVVPHPAPAPVAASTAAPPRTSGAPGVAEAMPPPPPPPEVFPSYGNRGAAQRAVGWFLLGAGVVGLSGGGYFTFKWLNDRDETSLHCVGQACDPTGTQYRSDTRPDGTTAIAFAAAGAGVVLVGAILIATAPAPRLTVGTASLYVKPVVNPRGTNGLAVIGSW